mmetsp:Transcript_20426/g.52773  ORF Transcript_20426/g.52773 Transcript_20426/m.52773 type:complete len:202 (-) Transcript_20426:420-1025(-)
MRAGVHREQEHHVEDDDRYEEEGRTRRPHGRGHAHRGTKQDGHRVARLGEDVEVGQNGEGDAIEYVNMRHDPPLDDSALEQLVRRGPHLSEHVAVHGDHEDERGHQDAHGTKRRAHHEDRSGRVHGEAPHHEEAREHRHGGAQVLGEEAVHEPDRWAEHCLQRTRDDVGGDHTLAELRDDVFRMDGMCDVVSDHKDVEEQA